jgi:putative transposase
MAQRFRRKPNRLPMDAYLGPRVYSLTLACERRGRWFTDGRLVADCIRVLRDAAGKHKARVYAYCFMPDHLHLLVHGGVRTFLPDLMHDFKQVTGSMFAKATGAKLWQDGYYDHVVRSEEGVHRVARYIAANPVRAGLALNAADYPHIGSIDWERAAIVEA